MVNYFVELEEVFSRKSKQARSSLVINLYSSIVRFRLDMEEIPDTTERSFCKWLAKTDGSLADDLAMFGTVPHKVCMWVRKFGVPTYDSGLREFTAESTVKLGIVSLLEGSPCKGFEELLLRMLHDAGS